MIYLVKSAAYDNGAFFKIGRTEHLQARLRAYGCTNPSISLLQTAITYKKTKGRLEKEIHNELKAQGYKFHKVFGITTEWVYIPQEKVEAFEQAGLAQFKACKGRLIQTVTEQPTI